MVEAGIRVIVGHSFDDEKGKILTFNFLSTRLTCTNTQEPEDPNKRTG
jgi:hypothetical protein